MSDDRFVLNFWIGPCLAVLGSPLGRSHMRRPPGAAPRLAGPERGSDAMTKEEKYMKEALKEAIKAYKKLEVPVGAVIVKDEEIIARAHNLKEIKNDTTKHAEILAIQKASKKIEAWRLEECEMYVTLEPCTMCAGAIINSRIKKVYIGTEDPKAGACGSVLNIFADYKFNHKVEYEIGIMQEECEKILKDFFKELRNMKKQLAKGG